MMPASNLKTALAFLAVLTLSVSVPALAALLNLTNDPTTGEPGIRAAEEIRGEAALVNHCFAG